MTGVGLLELRVRKSKTKENKRLSGYRFFFACHPSPITNSLCFWRKN
jgi:hypothetical protein